MVKTAVILAAGKPIDLDTPACLLPVSNKNILTSMIYELENLNFTKIIVVTGFKHDLIENSFQKHNIIWVHNPDYVYSGTMQSLSLAAQHITENFLLLDGDLIVPSHVIQATIKSAFPNTTVVSNLTGSGDETFVEVNKDSKIVGLSKDIRQLNTIHTEMIGITKVSYSIFCAMLEKYALTNNLWLNYEYVMMQLRERFPIHCLHVDNTPWIDIDDLKSYRKAQDSIISAVKLFEVNTKIVKEKITTAITEPIMHISLAGGMTNDNFKVTTAQNTYFVRLPGSGTDSMINRTCEPYNTKMIQHLQIDAPTILIDSLNGFKISEYLPNTITFSKRTARLPQNLKKVATLLQTLHQSDVTFCNEFNFLELLELYTNLLENPISYLNYQQALDSIKSIYGELLSKFDYCQAPCHNDLVPENFLLDDKNKLFLIDWEYSGINDYFWDLASYLLESEASKEEEYIFLSHYFNRLPSEQDLVKIKIYQAFQDILWAIWSLVKKEKNVNDFMLYGEQRYKRGTKTLEELMQYV